MRSAVLPSLLSLLVSCGPRPPMPTATPRPTVSSTIALTSDDAALWVVNPDADSVSVIDPAGRELLAEILLGTARPAVDPTTQRYDPAVQPRALAILPGDAKVYVAAQNAGKVFVLDAAQRKVSGSIPVGAEPVGVVAAPDGSAVYVVSHQAAVVTRIDPRTDQVVGTLAVAEHPWGASISADGKLLYISHLLLHAGVTVVDTATFTTRNTVELAAEKPDAALGKLIPNGVPRGVYAAVPRPGEGGGDLWMVHLLLAIGTPQPALDFQSTAFPTVSTLDADGRVEGKRLLFRPLLAGAGGAFNDSISGPRALAFTPDGKLALMVNSGSEDVLVFDGASGNERLLVRPLPATFLEGIAVDRAGQRAYVDGRNSHNVAVLKIDAADVINTVSVDGAAIERLTTDPMPTQLRLGQRLFYSANSAAFPITQNFWVSCSTCHLEGGTDAVTWIFGDGPRDTPSNAGGPINTGFLFRLARRNSVTQYDTTINVEQGGNFDRTRTSQLPLLEALAAYVNFAIPLPQNPHLAAGGALTDAQKRGQTTFNAACASCHSGPFYTDSGAGNPTLDMNGPVVLHDVGTCVTTGPTPDKPSADDLAGKPRTACDFDTPSLRGVFSTAPFLHDGSAATLAAVVDRLAFSATLDAATKADLVAFLETL